MAAPKVVVLFHHNQRRIEEGQYRITSLTRYWKAWGIRVDHAWGVRERFGADLLIPHIDLTVRPPEYQEFIERFPCVVNRKVIDISKRLISRNLLGPEDDWPGAVIVKTDRNLGGVPEEVVLHGRRKFKHPWWSRWYHRSWKRVRILSPGDYPVFPSLKSVPSGVFQNPALVVEKFTPEKREHQYVCRHTMFFGSEGYSRVRIADDHTVKGGRSEVGDRVADPPEVSGLRDRLGLDYGKIDWVFHDGRPVIFDVAKTMGGAPPGVMKAVEDMNRLLASGIRQWFPDLALEGDPPPLDATESG